MTEYYSDISFINKCEFKTKIPRVKFEKSFNY